MHMPTFTITLIFNIYYRRHRHYICVHVHRQQNNHSSSYLNKFTFWLKRGLKPQTFHLHSASFRMCLILLPQEISSKTFNTDHSGAQRSHMDQHRNPVGGNHSFLSEWIQIPLPSRIGAIKHTLRNHLGLHIRLQSTVSHVDPLFLPVILRINCNKVNNFCIYFNLSKYKYTAPILKHHNSIHSVEHRMFSCTNVLFVSIELY
jgi:hypothetical protein